MSEGGRGQCARAVRPSVLPSLQVAAVPALPPGHPPRLPWFLQLMPEGPGGPGKRRPGLGPRQSGTYHRPAVLASMGMVKSGSSGDRRPVRGVGGLNPACSSHAAPHSPVRRQPNLHHAIGQSVNHFSSNTGSKKGAKHAAVDQPPVQGLPGPGDGQEDYRRSVSCLRSRSSAAGARLLRWARRACSGRRLTMSIANVIYIRTHCGSLSTVASQHRCCRRCRRPLLPVRCGCTDRLPAATLQGVAETVSARRAQPRP